MIGEEGNSVTEAFLRDNLMLTGAFKKTLVKCLIENMSISYETRLSSRCTPRSQT